MIKVDVWFMIYYGKSRVLVFSADSSKFRFQGPSFRVLWP